MKKLPLSQMPALYAAMAQGGALYLPVDNAAGDAQFM